MVDTDVVEVVFDIDLVGMVVDTVGDTEYAVMVD